MKRGDVIASIAAAISLLALMVSVLTILEQRYEQKVNNLVTVYEFLHEGNLSEARRRIREDDIPLSLSNNDVLRVCSSFDFAGNLVRNGAVDEEIFFGYWGSALRALHAKLKDMGEEETGPLKVREYYNDFWWLMEEAERRKRST